MAARSSSSCHGMFCGCEGYGAGRGRYEHCVGTWQVEQAGREETQRSEF